MCIAIWKLDDKAETTGDYSLVLAFNRDEYFDRPTRGFHIWEDKPNICAPLDLKPLNEAHRGSWIGVNRKGRLAFLTNFRERVPHHDGKISRGALVRDFLLDHPITPGGQHVQTHSSNRDTVIEYAEKVYSERELYDGFNLVLFDLHSEHKTAVYVSNRGQNEDGSRGSMCVLDQGQVIGLSNSIIDDLWPKVSRGCDRFAHTLSGLRSFANDDDQDTHTIAALLDAMRDSSPFSNVDDADVPQKIEDLAQLRRRQVEALTRALGQFVSLKSTAEGWQPIPALSTAHAESVSGGDVSVHLDRKLVDGSDMFRMTASIPLDADVSKDTQGMYSAYLSELRDWQGVLESPGIRSVWNYFMSSSTTLEMLDAHTRITRSQVRNPVPGQKAAFAHERDLLMVETSLVDPTTVVFVATSFPTTDDDPAYLRQQANVKRVESRLWAWCVELGTPVDAISASTQRTPGLSAARKPRACVQVTCFMHLELHSWKSNNTLACRAATNLVPALVAYLRLHGAPPRLARIGPSIALERTEWQMHGDESVWEAVYAVATRSSQASEVNQPIIARILDLETTSRPQSASQVPPALSQHMRKVSSLTTYLSSSFERQQGEASALGTHGGGILRDGEEESVVATRAQLTGSILELVVDASKWHSDHRSVDISMAVRGFSSARQLFESIGEMHSAAPELFTTAQLEQRWDAFKKSQATGTENDQIGLAGVRKQRDAECEMVLALAAQQLVRCYSIRSQKSTRRRYLLRILNPPVMVSSWERGGSDGESAESTFVSEASDSSTLDRVYSVAIAVSRGVVQESKAGVQVNGHCVEITPFTLDPAPIGNVRSVSASSSKRVAKARIAMPQPKPSVRPIVLAATPESRTPTPEPRNIAPSSFVLAARDSVVSASRRASMTPSVSSSLVQATGEMSDTEDVELQDIPFQALQHVTSVATGEWVSMGMTGAVAVSRTDVDGMVLRAEAVVDGWTVFDVSALVCNVQLTKEVSGLWTEAQDIEQIGASASVLRCASHGTWAVAAREAFLCRAWRTNARSSRVDIAECSVDDKVLSDEPAQTIRAEVALSAWVLDKASVSDTPDERLVRQRSASVATGSPAVDAEVESQRRKQHAVRVTHYLKYNPRGWLSVGDNMGMRQFGAMLGIDAKSTLFPPIPPAGVRDALVDSVTKLTRELNAHGVPPSIVWSRNAQCLSVEAALDHVQFQYRMAAWGAPQRTASMGSSMASRHTGRGRALAALTEDSEFVEMEFRIEHRIWASGHVTVVVEPFFATSAVACFVDPEVDPHATRIRVSHHRAQLLPRVEEAADGVQTAWPTVHVAVARSASVRSTSLSSSSKPWSAVEAHVAPWSVPPRLTINGVAARVRYLRRDENGRGFYARCVSVATHEVPRLARLLPVEGLYMERMPSPEPDAHREPELHCEPDMAMPTNSDLRPHAAQIAIQKYSVQAELGADYRLARPEQFAKIIQQSFTRMRHEIELLDVESARSRWMQMRQLEDGDTRSLMTAREDPNGWAQRQNGDVAVYERLDADLSAEIPVTVGISVLQGVSVQQVAQVLAQRWERARWDRVLFDERRELEHVGDGVHVEHAGVHVPLLFDTRDALTVAAVEQAPYLPARQRLRNWQQGLSNWQGVEPICGGRPGDYFDATVTHVEASVPGSQPISSAVRTHVPMYAVRIDPIDGFERARGHAYAYPSCRVTIACCADIVGSVPLPLRRALSARVPEQHIEQLRQRLHEPLWPRLGSPSRVRRTALRGAHVLGEVVEEDVDGQRLSFYRRFDGALVEHETLQGHVFEARVRVPGSIPCDVADHVAGLRKDGMGSAPVPVVSDVVVDARMFPRGIDVRVFVGSAHSGPIIERCDLDAIPSGAWAMGGLAVYVFAQSSQYVVRTVTRACSTAEAIEGQLCTVTVQAAQKADASVFCNGQRLRVHQAQTAQQALLAVHTSAGMVGACDGCGSIGCGADAYASDGSDTVRSQLVTAPVRPVRALSTGSVQMRTEPQSAMRQRRLVPKTESPPPPPPSANRTESDMLGTWMLAVLMPARRLTIGGLSVVGTKRRRSPSTLALALVLIVACVCLRLGATLAHLLLYLFF
ncbi:hypothetical protein GGH96_004981 [Coemansia sp. RSA 1972]|nr:hypothetical protein GGH96_004981 [Coemansia sp. RSA 1972]